MDRSTDIKFIKLNLLLHFRGSISFEVQSYEVQSHSRFGYSRFGPIRGSVLLEVGSFEVRSLSSFGHLRFGPIRGSVIRGSVIWGSVFRRSVFRASVFRGSVIRGSITASRIQITIYMAHSPCFLSPLADSPLLPFAPPSNPSLLTWNPPSCDRIRPPQSQVACKLTSLFSILSPSLPPPNSQNPGY